MDVYRNYNNYNPHVCAGILAIVKGRYDNCPRTKTQ